MKKLLKKYIPGKMVSLLRRMLSRNERKFAKACYLADLQRFLKYSGAYGTKDGVKLEMKIVKEYHVVEKSLTMPERMAGHGAQAVLNLVASILEYERLGFDMKGRQLVHAIGVLKEWISYNKHLISDDLRLADAVALCDRHTSVPSCPQQHFTRNDFFALKKAPFPAFAVSRHTVRNYSPECVDIEKIKTSVETARYAPSACNRQYVKVAMILGREKIDSILALQGGSRGFGHLATALLIVISDIRGVGSPRERNDVYTNGGMFMMALCYALHYNEVTHCILNWSKGPEEDCMLRRLVSLNPSEVVVALIACGEPPDEFDVALSPRRDIDELFSIRG